MSNKNRNLVNNNNKETETKKPGWFKQQIEKVNLKSTAKTVGKIAVGFCALVGAAGLGSYAADQIGKKSQVPDITTDTTTAE